MLRIFRGERPAAGPEPADGQQEQEQTSPSSDASRPPAPSPYERVSRPAGHEAEPTRAAGERASVPPSSSAGLEATQATTTQPAAATQAAATKAEATQPAAAQPAEDEQSRAQAPAEPGFLARGNIRRRARFLRAARELAYRDLGGLVFDLHRFGTRNDEIVQAKLSTLGRIDAELRALEAALEQRTPLTVLRQAGVSACPRCAAIHGSFDRFCPTCGLPVKPDARPIAAPAPQTTTSSRPPVVPPRPPVTPASQAPQPGTHQTTESGAERLGGQPPAVPQQQPTQAFSLPEQPAPSVAAPPPATRRRPESSGSSDQGGEDASPTEVIGRGRVGGGEG